MATLLNDAPAECEVLVRGPREGGRLRVLDAIQTGHKIALRDIAEGDPVLKYRSRIGEATRPIRAGEWVHLHNCRSLYDAASSSLDLHTGARTETRYA